MKLDLRADVDGIVKDTLEVALTEVLAKNGGTVIKHLVEHALRADGKFGKSVLRTCLNAAVQDAARRRIAEWVDANKDKIAALVDGQLRALLTPELVTSNIMRAVRQVNVYSRPFTPLDDPDDEDEQYEDEEQRS